MLEKEAIIKKLQDYFAKKQEVEFAYLFGSVARDEANKLSDIDIAVMCKGKCSILRMMSEIAHLLRVEDVDVVDLNRLRNNSILMDIIREGIVLKSSDRQEEWEIKSYHKVLDFFTSTRLVYGY